MAWNRRQRTFVFVFILWVPAFCVADSAMDDSGDVERRPIPAETIALELANPVTLLASFGIDYEYRTYQGDLPGADGLDSQRMVFSPSWPIRLRNGKNLLLSARIPINGDQPQWNPVSYLTWEEFLIRQAPAPGSDPDSRWSLDPATGAFSYGHGNLGNVSFDIGYGGISDGGTISALNLVNVAVTSDDLSARRGQWLLGPELILGKTTRWGLFGFRAKHLTNVYGEGDQELDYDTNETTLNPFVAWSLGNGWQVESSPVILYDWEAVGGNQWYVPVGAGISKTTSFGRVPVKMALELQYFAVSPDRFGQEWLLRVNLTPVLSTRQLR
jgi:hypothetical protein